MLHGGGGGVWGRMAGMLCRRMRVITVVYMTSFCLFFFMMTSRLPRPEVVLQDDRADGITQPDKEETRDTPPHIVLIVVDDLGWDDVGYHGSDILTPHIDELAMTGVRLENYYVERTCTPSRAALLTGLYDIHLGLQFGDIDASVPVGMPTHVPTLAQKLRDRGYATHLVGKWHLGFHTKHHLPTARGFNTFHGFVTDRVDYYSHIHCENTTTSANKQTELCGIDYWENNVTNPQSKWPPPSINQQLNDSDYSTIKYTQRSIDVLAQHPPDQPLFLMLSYQTASMPYQVPSMYEEMYPEVEDDNRRKYAGMITCLDDQIGVLLEGLEELGFWNNTLLVFTTDNGAPLAGAGSNWPLRGGKGSLWEGALRGVGFVSGPRLHGFSGRQINDLMHITDWYPTLLRLADPTVTNNGEPVDGFDMWDSLSLGVPGNRSEILHTIAPTGLSGAGDKRSSVATGHAVAALRSGHWKLIVGDPGDGERKPPPELVELPGVEKRLQSDPINPQDNLFLYHLRRDPYEIHNVARSHPDVVKDLLTRLDTYWLTAHTPLFHKASPAKQANRIDADEEDPWRLSHV